MDITIRYLYNSGFSVRLADHTLLLDPCTPEDVPPEDLQAPFVDVFVSHIHSDHYNPKIFQWRAVNPSILYFLSSDIPKQPGTLQIWPHRQVELNNVVVRALRSTDAGVAFLLQVEGLSIYHAGDLNWWHWDGEDPDWNRRMGNAYHAEMRQLRRYLGGRRIDLAFVPVDPRLERTYLWGLNAFMQIVGADYVVPMHFGDDWRIFDWLQKDPAAAPYRDRIAVLHRRGEVLRHSITGPISPTNTHLDLL